MYGENIQDQNNCQRIEGILEFSWSDKVDHSIIQGTILPFRTSPTFLRTYMLGECAEGLKFSGGEEDRERQKQLEMRHKYGKYQQQ